LLMDAVLLCFQHWVPQCGTLEFPPLVGIQYQNAYYMMIGNRRLLAVGELRLFGEMLQVWTLNRNWTRFRRSIAVNAEWQTCSDSLPKLVEGFRNIRMLNAKCAGTFRAKIRSVKMHWSLAAEGARTTDKWVPDAQVGVASGDCWICCYC